MKLYGMVAVAAGIMISAGLSRATLPTGLTVLEEPDRVLMRWNGPVEPPMLDRFEAAFRAREGDSRRIVISLSSPGGLVEYGYQVISLIKKEARAHTIDTLVEAGRTCASMCVPIYLTGADRIAHPKAQFMFHEVSFRLNADQERQVREIKRSHPFIDIQAMRKDMIVKATDEFYEVYLGPRGVNQRWLTDMRRSIRGRDIWRTGTELVEQGSGVVDVLRSRPEVAAR